MTARRWLILLALLLPTATMAERIEETLPLTLPSGASLPVRVLRPAQAPDKLPAIILLGGYQRGAAALDLVSTDQPVLLAGFDYPVELPRKLRVREIPELLPKTRRAITDTRGGIAALHQALSRRPDVDPRRITLVGVSAGAPFATLAAADARIPAVILVHGFADLPEVIEHQFARRWEPKHGWLGRIGAWLSSRLLHGLLRLPSIEESARSLDASQRVLMIRATEDDFVPKAGSDALETALRASRARVEVLIQPGGHIRGAAPERLQPVLKASMEWMEREGLI